MAERFSDAFFLWEDRSKSLAAREHLMDVLQQAAALADMLFA